MSAPAVATATVLTVDRLHAWIGPQQILRDVSFSVPATGITALLGRNGVGKTTTLRAVLGLIRRRGSVRLAGAEIGAEPTHRIVRRGVGYVPENREVFAGLTVAENLRLARRQGNAAETVIAELFPELVRRREQLAGTLSGGQQQMVALARALLNDNALLLIDEPTQGLAPKIVIEVTATLQAAAARVPMLLVEQDLAVVAQLASSVVVMAEGQVVHTGPAEEFLSDQRAVRAALGVSGRQW